MLSYDPETGVFTWRVRCGNRCAGAPAGSVSQTTGYMTIGVDGPRYQAGRVAWLIVTGAWPEGEVDHRNRLKTDNRWENLRLASRKDQTGNVGLRRDNSTGVRGVQKVRSRWRALLNVKGARRHLGYFGTKEAAAEAYRAAAKAHYGEFAPCS